MFNQAVVFSELHDLFTHLKIIMIIIIIIIIGFYKTKLSMIDKPVSQPMNKQAYWPFSVIKKKPAHGFL